MKKFDSEMKGFTLLWPLALLSLGAGLELDSWEREHQRYDGWYNNYGHIAYGSVKSYLIYLAPPIFGDEVYLPRLQGRPPAGLISAELMKEDKGVGNIPFVNQRTAFFSFFGQAVSGEILSTVSSGKIGCPIERIPLKLFRSEDCPGGGVNTSLSCDPGKGSPAPFFRAPYDIETGFHFNNPRRTFNWVSSWIDGSFIYSTDTWWADALRRFEGGKLGKNGSSLDPGRNPERVPILNPPPPATHPDFEEEERLYLVGSFKSNQEPPLLGVSFVLHRLHNHFAEKIAKEVNQSSEADHWGDDSLFHRARQFVIAVWQNVIMYEYVPALLGQGFEWKKYAGYRVEVDPSISAEFQGAAFRFGHSLVPPHFSVLNDECVRTNISLCSAWWNSQNMMEKYGLKNILRGTIFQQAESGDHRFPRMLRENLFGGLRRTQMDLPAVNILRGRDLGISDYNSVRKALGLPMRETWTEINPSLFSRESELLARAEELYGIGMDNIDLYVGGLLESHDGLPGETFRTIISDQFTRIRDGDRFWFENELNGLFSDSEVAEIKSYTMAHILEVTVGLGSEEVRDDMFRARRDRQHSSVNCIGSPIEGPAPEPCGPSGKYDFMEGSKISFVLSFGLLALFPLVLIIVTRILASCRRSNLPQVISDSFSRKVESRPMKETFQAVEFDGPKSSKQVQLKLGPGPLFRLLDHEGSIVRSVEIDKLDFAEVRISFNGNDTALLLHIPKGYDVILFFPNMEDRREFMHYFQAFLQASDKTVVNTYLPFDEFIATAVTASARKRTLKTFFHTAFDQVFRAKQRTSNVALKWPRYTFSLRKKGTEKEKDRSALFHLELNTTEFAEALQLKVNSTFVKQMFAMADKDNNGFISYQEFVDMLVILSKGTFETKMRMLFDIYDLDGSGDLNQEEFYTMIRSLLEITNRNVSDQLLASIISAMLQECGLKEKSFLNFQDFYSLVEKNQTVVWNSAVMEQSWGLTKNERSFVDINKVGSTMVVRVLEEEEWSFLSWLRYSCRRLENNWTHILYVTLYLLFAALLFTQYFFKYGYLNEHKSLRQVVGWGASVSRGSAMALSFTLALLLLCVCRHLLSWLRNSPAVYYLPVDSSITFHRFLAYMALLFMTVHIIGHGINFYQISTQPPQIIRCILPEVYVPTYKLLKFDYWLFQTVPGITGVLLVIVTAVIYVFATQWARRHIYASFRLTHNLYPLFFALLFLHGSRSFLQAPVFPLFIVGPLGVFTLDWLIRLRRRSVHLELIRADTLPSEVLHLSFKLPESVQFFSGQWVRLACSELSLNDFHPFTITSAPHERTLDVFIRSVGPWTKRIHSLFKTELSQGGKHFPRIILDGPHGSKHQDWFKFKTVVLIGAGIGVTPHASVLKDLVHKVYQQNKEIRTKKVYFVWLSRNHMQFEWFLDILAQVEEADRKELIHMDIFVTQLIKDFDIRTMMLYICESQFQRLSNRSLFTGLKAKTHFGRIDFLEYFQAIKRSNSGAKKVGVFSCGPKSAIGAVESVCNRLNQSGVGPQLIAKHEIF